MKEYMLIFSLGPVQSFIAQARKTRDLWLGSFLLSTLMEAGMKDTDKAAFVFPSKQTIDGRIPDLPNKFIATFNTDVEAKACVERTEKQIENAWRSMCDDVWAKVIQPYSSSSQRLARCHQAIGYHVSRYHPISGGQITSATAKYFKP